MQIYEPAEDTWLLVDYAREIKGKHVLEIGCGAGYVSVALAKQNKVCAVDINQQAVQATCRLARSERVKLNCFVSDLFENVRGKFDVIVFNFPYIPEAITKETLNWAAGENLELIERFARQAPRYLRQGGKVIFVISSLTGLAKVKKIFAKSGMRTKIIKKSKIAWETLYLMEAFISA